MAGNYVAVLEVLLFEHLVAVVEVLLFEAAITWETYNGITCVIL